MKKILASSVASLGFVLTASAVELSTADYSTTNISSITASGVPLTDLASGKSVGFTLTFTLNEAGFANAFVPVHSNTNYSLVSLTDTSSGSIRVNIFP